MNEHLQELKSGGRPMTKLELANKEIERLNKENEELKNIQCTFLGTGCKLEIERLHSIIKEVRELLNQEWYSVLRKGTITKVKEILDYLEEKENE